MDISEKLEFLDQISKEDIFWEHREQLTELATDEDSQVREKALLAFWHLPDPTYIDLLLDAAQRDPLQEVRTAAIASLGRFIYEGFVMEELDEQDYGVVKECLLELHQDNDEPVEVRRAALEAVGFITDQEIEDLVRKAYQNSEGKMRVSALFAMGRSGTRTWDEILLAEMQNPDPEIRFEAVRAAGETFMESAAETLERLTEDSNRDIRLAAIHALGKAGRLESKAVLLNLSRSPDEDIRDAAASALKDIETFEKIEMDVEGTE